MFLKPLTLFYSFHSRICLVELTEIFKWNILKFVLTKLHTPSSPIYSLLIPSCCNGRKVHSFESNPVPPQKPVCYLPRSLLNLQLLSFCGPSLLIWRWGALVPRYQTSSFSKLWSYWPTPSFLNIPPTSQGLHVSLQLRMPCNLSSGKCYLNHWVKGRFLCSLFSYILLSFLRIYLTL